MSKDKLGVRAGSREPNQQAVSSVPASILDAVGLAIEAAGCPHREGPFGGYDYGHNTDFYGPEPEAGRYVVRDFRDTSSPNYGRWVHQTHDNDDHDAAFETLTRRHIAKAAINAYTQAIEARQGGDAGSIHESAVGEADAPKEGKNDAQ